MIPSFPSPRTVAWLGLLFVLVAAGAHAQLFGGPPPADLELNFAIQPDTGRDNGGLPMAAAVLKPHDGWYAYAREPGDVGTPADLEAKLATPGSLAFTTLGVAYLPGEEKPDPLDPALMSRVYDGPTPFFIPLPANAEPGDQLELTLNVLMCSASSCKPGIIERVATLPDPATLGPAEGEPWSQIDQAVTDAPQQAAEAPVLVQAPAAPPEPVIDQAPARLELTPRYHQTGLEVKSLAKAMLLALAAGFLLNFMPCVLPVIGLKLGTFVNVCGQGDKVERRNAFRVHNLYFALGVLVYFGVLAVAFSLLDMAWGEMFQRPSVVLVLTCVVFAMSLALMGVYNLPIIDVGHAPDEERRPRVGAFVTGLLATLLATPCSGPMLGGVLAFALTGPPLIVASVLFCVGLGMAAPYLVLTAFPGLARFMPCPGAWNLHLERFLGLVLAGTCIYLLSILPKDYQLRALALMWLTALVAWAVPLLGGLKHGRARRLAVKTVGFVLLGAGMAFAISPLAKPLQWQTYSEEYLLAAMGKERLLLDFTADWCVSCKFLEQTTFSPGNLAEWAETYGLRFIKVDLTAENPEGQRLLAALGAKSIPTVAVFPDGDGADQPLVLRDLFTASDFEEAMDGVLEAEE